MHGVKLRAAETIMYRQKPFLIESEQFAIDLLDGKIPLCARGKTVRRRTLQVVNCRLCGWNSFLYGIFKFDRFAFFN